jgi:hypothetical protein
MATSAMGIKHKPLSISEKLNIISKVDGTPNALCTKIAEELGILWQHFTQPCTTETEFLNSH